MMAADACSFDVTTVMASILGQPAIATSALGGQGEGLLGGSGGGAGERGGGGQGESCKRSDCIRVHASCYMHMAASCGDIVFIATVLARFQSAGCYEPSAELSLTTPLDLKSIA